jgi:hypothetical protein
MTDTPDSQRPDHAGWWVVRESRLRELLDRAANGEDPDLIVAEEYANSEDPEAGDTDG